MTASTGRSFWSLTRKVTFAVAAAIVVCVAVVAAALSQTASETRRAGFVDSAASISALVAQSMGGAVRFAKTDQVETQLTTFIETQNGRVGWAAAYSKSGERVGGVGAPGAEATALASQALEAGAPQSSADGLTRAEIVRFGKKNSVGGALVVSWSDAALIA
ncbi:MAG: hypothetical protein AAFR16_11430, partial [Pseudomonadota bacterium]